MKKSSKPFQVDSYQTLTSQAYLNLQKILRCLNIGRGYQIKRLPITVTQMRVLSLFNDRKTIPISEISHSLSLSLQSTINLIQRLEVLGYLERFKNRHDRRISEVRLTSKGKKKLSLFRRGEQETLDGLLNYLNFTEKKMLNDSLKKAANLFEKAILSSSIRSKNNYLKNKPLATGNRE